MFFVPTNLLFKMSYFRKSKLQKKFQLFFAQNHYKTHISGSSEPRIKGMVPNDSQQIGLQFEFLIHHLRWCV